MKKQSAGWREPDTPPTLILAGAGDEPNHQPATGR